MPMPGVPELIVIALVVILLFGFKRLPDAARSLGRSARVFKAEVNEMKAEDEARKSTPGTTTPASPPAQVRDADGNALREDHSPRTDNQSGPIA